MKPDGKGSRTLSYIDSFSRAHPCACRVDQCGIVLSNFRRLHCIRLWNLNSTFGLLMTKCVNAKDAKYWWGLWKLIMYHLFLQYIPWANTCLKFYVIISAPFCFIAGKERFIRWNGVESISAIVWSHLSSGKLSIGLTINTPATATYNENHNYKQARVSSNETYL